MNGDYEGIEENGGTQNTEESVKAPTTTSAPTWQGKNMLSLAELSKQLGVGVQTLQAAIDLWNNLRRAALSLTAPEDWLLFRDPEGRITCYLQDCGCARVRPLYGISIYNVSKPEKMTQTDGSFTYIISGSGFCARSLGQVESIEGARSSTDDFITKQNPPLTGTALDLAVRKAARSNLDGSITRELAGLESVPLEEIMEIYQKTDPTKVRARFREGRGFGKKGERSFQGEMAPDKVQPPKCPKCHIDMVLRKGNKGSFYGCPNFRSKDCKETLNESDWLEQLAARKPATNGTTEEKSGFTKASEVAAATFPPEIIRLGGILIQLQQADKSLTPDAVCKQFFTIEGTAYTYEQIKTWKAAKTLRLISKACDELEKKYATILPPTTPPDNEGQGELGL